jgi:multidrug efflux pump subunit AcrB
MEATYRRILALFMRQKWLAFAILGVCLVLIVVFVKTLKSELAPLEDHSLIRANITLPEGTGFDYTQNLVDRIAQLEMDSISEARLIFAGAGLGGGATNTGVVQTFLVEPNERKMTQQQIFDKASKMYKRFPAARVIPNQEQTISTSLSAGRQLPVQFVVQNLDFGKLQEALPKFLEQARSDPVFGSIDVDLKFNKPEVDLTINRLKATDLGVNVVDVSTTLDYALSGRLYDYFLRNGKQRMVIGQVEREERNKPADIPALYVRNNIGNLIQLDNLVSMTENSSPPTLYHYNRFKSATVSATLAQGKALGEGIAAMRKIAGKVLDETDRKSVV